jgi:hypothetical protein
MAEQRHFWTFDRTIFDQIELPGFTWREVSLIVLALAGLAAYFLLVRLLDYRTHLRIRRAKAAARLERWLDEADLSDRQMDTLAHLAGGASTDALHRLLSDTVTFETRVHAAYREHLSGELEFIPALREQLGHEAANLRVPMVSTRQLRAGDAVRITVWEGGLPQHHYGSVGEVGHAVFTVNLRPQAAAAVRSKPGEEVELYYLRGFDTEYRFPCRMAPVPAQDGELTLFHVLLVLGQGPLEVRLPLLRDVEYQLLSSMSPDIMRDEVSALDPETAGASPRPAVLFDLSEGGFSLVTDTPVPEERYVRMSLPLRKGRRRLTLTGKTRQCREFSGHQWLVRCALRDITPRERNYLQQIVHAEHRRRLRTLAPVRRVARQEGQDTAAPIRPAE